MTLQQAKQWIVDHSATIMSWVATVGTVGGSVLTAMAVPKAQKRLEAALMDKREAEGDDAELTVLEKVKAGAPAFIPAMLAEAATIGCIHGSNAVNKLEIAKLNEEVVMTAAALSAYAKSVGEITNPTVEYAAMKHVEQQTLAESRGELPWDERKVFYFHGQSKFFERTMEDVFQAEMLANRALALRGYVTLNEFFDLLELPHVPDGDNYGWDEYLGEVYFGYHWIDFMHPWFTSDDGLKVTEIRAAPYCEPHILDEEVLEQDLSDTWQEMLERFGKVYE